MLGTEGPERESGWKKLMPSIALRVGGSCFGSGLVFPVVYMDPAKKKVG